MKSKKQKKLMLLKTTIASLDTMQMGMIAGGGCDITSECQSYIPTTCDFKDAIPQSSF